MSQYDSHDGVDFHVKPQRRTYIHGEWISLDGKRKRLVDLDAEHLFNIARMLWNHKVMGPRIPGGNLWEEVYSWGEEYCDRYVDEIALRLRIRSDKRGKLFNRQQTNKKENKMKNVVVNVGSSKAIQDLVQEILFKAGASWGSGAAKKVQALASGYDTLGVENGYIYQGRSREFTGDWRSYKNFAAESDLSGLVKFLDEKEVVTIKLNDQYTATVGKTHTDVGGEKIPNSAILAVAAEIEKK